MSHSPRHVNCLIANPNFATYKQRTSRSPRHVNYPVLLGEEAQQSVVLDAVCDTTRVDADASLRIVDVGPEMEGNAIHVRRALTQEGRSG